MEWLAERPAWEWQRSADCDQGSTDERRRSPARGRMSRANGGYTVRHTAARRRGGEGCRTCRGCKRGRPGGVVEFRYPTEDDPCLLIRLAGGRLVAYGQKCSHLSCAVIPEPAREALRCPCHNGSFEMREGRPLAGPPRRPLPRVTLAVRGGVIYATGVELRTV